MTADAPYKESTQQQRLHLICALLVFYHIALFAMHCIGLDSYSSPGPLTLGCQLFWRRAQPASTSAHDDRTFETRSSDFGATAFEDDMSVSMPLYRGRPGRVPDHRAEVVSTFT